MISYREKCKECIVYVIHEENMLNLYFHAREICCIYDQRNYIGASS